jgi:hypothetical protein
VPEDVATLVAEAVTQARAGAPLVFQCDEHTIVQHRRRFEHRRGDDLLVSVAKTQSWRRTLRRLVEAAVAMAAQDVADAPSRSPLPRAILPLEESASRETGDTTAMPQLYTEGGYVLGEVISALQKEIRRGEEAGAMYWALELTPKYEAYLWRRLNVIVQEDIGIANVALLSLVPSQEAQWFRFRQEGKDGTCRLILANTILAMCRSAKSRLADHFQCVVNQGRLHGERREVPDYALDKHTGRGKAKKRGVEHWRDEGCVLLPDAGLDDPYADRAYEWWASPEFVQTAWGKRGVKGKPAEEQAELF